MCRYNDAGAHVVQKNTATTAVIQMRTWPEQRKGGEFTVNALFLLAGREDRRHPATLHPGRLVDLRDVLQFLDKAAQNVHPLILIDDVPAAKLDPGFDLVAVVEKSARVLRFEVEVVRVGMRPKTYFLHLHVLRLLTRFLLLLLELVPVLAVVDDFANRRAGRRRNLDQVEFIIACAPQRLIDIVNPMIAIGLDKADLWAPYFFVDANFSCDGSLSLVVDKYGSSHRHKCVGGRFSR